MIRSWTIAAAIVIAQLCPASAEEVLKVAIGGRGAMESAPPELGQDAGFFARHGLKLDLIYTAGSGETLQAVIAGAVDIGSGVGTVATFGAFVKGAPVRAIGATMKGANDSFWYVRADSPVKSVQDFGGKTVAFSTVGASTQAVVLGFRDFFKVDLKPVATGAQQGTYTQVMSGQVDVGWSAGATFLSEADEGKIRIVARGNDLPYLREPSPRLLVANRALLESRKGAVEAFMQAYRETVDWIYASPDAMTAFSKWSGFPRPIAERVRDTAYTNRAIDPDSVSGLDQLMSDAVKFKYLQAPLSDEQIGELFAMPKERVRRN